MLKTFTWLWGVSLGTTNPGYHCWYFLLVYCTSKPWFAAIAQGSIAGGNGKQKSQSTLTGLRSKRFHVRVQTELDSSHQLVQLTYSCPDSLWTNSSWRSFTGSELLTIVLHLINALVKLGMQALLENRDLYTDKNTQFCTVTLNLEWRNCTQFSVLYQCTSPSFLLAKLNE